MLPKSHRRACCLIAAKYCGNVSPSCCLRVLNVQHSYMTFAFPTKWSSRSSSVFARLDFRSPRRMAVTYASLKRSTRATSQLSRLFPHQFSWKTSLQRHMPLQAFATSSMPLDQIQGSAAAAASRSKSFLSILKVRWFLSLLTPCYNSHSQIQIV